MAGKPEPARCPQRRLPGLTRGGQISGSAALCPLGLSFCASRVLLGATLGSFQAGGRQAALFACLPTLFPWSNEHRGVQTFALPGAHRPSPHSAGHAADGRAGANQSVSGSRTAPRSRDQVAVVPVCGCEVPMLPRGSGANAVLSSSTVSLV